MSHCETVELIYKFSSFSTNMLHLLVACAGVPAESPAGNAEGLTTDFAKDRQEEEWKTELARVYTVFVSAFTLVVPYK